MDTRIPPLNISAIQNLSSEISRTLVALVMLVMLLEMQVVLLVVLLVVLRWF